jgi:predicted Zn-dependent protease
MHDRRHALRLLFATAGVGALTGCGNDGLPVDLVSDAQMRQLGLKAWERTLEEHRPIDDVALQRAVRSQADRLLAAAGEAPEAWQVTVFAADEANAFVVPGRKMGIYEGMVATTANRAQLAAVIGHEIGHHQAEHAEERLETALATRTGLALAEAALDVGNVAFADEIAAVLGLGAEYGVLLPYSRAHELEADRLGMRTMAKAGYDPAAAVDLWRRMAELQTARPPAFLSTHPSPETRIDALEAYVDEARTAAG